MPHHFILNRGKLFSERYKNLKQHRPRDDESVRPKREKEEKDDEVEQEKSGHNCVNPSAIVDTKDEDSDSLMSFDSGPDLDEPGTPDSDSGEPSASTNRNPSQEKDQLLFSSPISSNCDPIPECDVKPKEVTVKFRFNSKIYRITLGYSDFLWKFRKTICKTLGINPKTHQLRITHNDKFLTFDETPEELGITVADILDCYTKDLHPSSSSNRRKADSSNNSTASSKIPSDPNLIRIKFRNNKETKNSAPVVSIASKKDSLSKVMEEYSKKVGHPLNKLTFEFDGDKISGEETPIDLDMDDESLVDVQIKE